MSTSASKQPCFAHDHLTCAEYGLWTLGRELSYKKSVLYFDGQNMAARFRRSGGKNTMYRLMHALIKSGWFIVLEPRKRKSNGQWSAHALRVLSHDEWVKAHPKECKTDAENDEQPVPISSSACPEIEELPVPKTGHSIGIPLQSGKNLQLGDNLVKSTCPEFGNGIRALTQVLTCPKKSKAESAVEHVCAACPDNGTGPVPITGQDGSDCPTPENPPVSPPVPKRRRTMQELTKLANTTHTTVEALIAGGTFELAA
jgi:hypothetical protein